MLPILHKAPNLYREDAYREYCYNVDAWGAYQPASFIYLCFEAFREVALDHDLLLTVEIPQENRESKGFPSRAQREWDKIEKTVQFYGLICSLSVPNAVESIKTFLEQGHNVIAMIPNDEINIYYHNEKYRADVISKVQSALISLDLEKLVDRVPGSSYFKRNIWWDVISYGKAKLFLTEDGFLSDGYFLDGYGKSDENTTSINRLVRSFSVRQEPLLIIRSESQFSHWNCHEAFILQINLKNFGPQLKDCLISILLDETCEPVSSTEIFLPVLAALSEVSVVLQFIPRVAKRITPIKNISIVSQNKGAVTSISNIGDLNVITSLQTFLRSQQVADDEAYSRLQAIVQKSKEVTELRNFSELARVDTEACLNKLRKVAERLALITLHQANASTRSLDFNGAIRELQTRKLVSNKSIGYLHTIRVIGNLASHPTGETLSLVDVRVAAYALATVIEEIFEKGIIK